MALICNEYTDDTFPSSHAHAYLVTNEKVYYKDIKKMFKKEMNVRVADIERPTNFRETARYVTKYDRQAVVFNVPLKYTASTWRGALYAKHHTRVNWGDQIPSTIAPCDRKVFEDVVSSENELDDRKIITTRTDVHLLPWQQMLVDIIENDDRSRTVYWVVDTIGGGGKSLMAQYLIRNNRGIIYNDFNYRDNSYIYNKEEIVVFDIPRDTNLENCSLQFLEDLKNGYLISQKYEVRRKIFNIPHVVVFSNSMPVKEKLSLDRWHVLNMYNMVVEVLEGPFVPPRIVLQDRIGFERMLDYNTIQID